MTPRSISRRESSHSGRRLADQPIVLTLIAAGLVVAVWIHSYVAAPQHVVAERESLARADDPATAAAPFNVAAKQESSDVRASVKTSQATDGRPSSISAPAPSATPFNVAAGQTALDRVSPITYEDGGVRGVNLSAPSAAPVWGVTKAGAAYWCELHPPYPLLRFCATFPAGRGERG